MNCEFCIWNCSRLRGRLEYATGGNAERWKEKMFGAAAACRDKHRRSAVRAEAPPCGGSQNSPRWLRHESFCAIAIKTDNCLRIAKPQKTGGKQPQTNNDFLLILSRHYAASGLLNLPNHADKSRNPCHSGCEVAGSEDKTKIIHAEKFTGETDAGSESECKEKHSMA